MVLPPVPLMVYQQRQSFPEAKFAARRVLLLLLNQSIPKKGNAIEGGQKFGGNSQPWRGASAFCALLPPASDRQAWGWQMPPGRTHKWTRSGRSVWDDGQREAYRFVRGFCRSRRRDSCAVWSGSSLLPGRRHRHLDAQMDKRLRRAEMADPKCLYAASDCFSEALLTPVYAFIRNQP